LGETFSPPHLMSANQQELSARFSGLVTAASQLPRDQFEGTSCRFFGALEAMLEFSLPITPERIVAAMERALPDSPKVSRS
jgi:hypothetical protein